MKKLFLFAALAVLLTAISCSSKVENYAQYNIVPQPESIVVSNAEPFTLKGNTVIAYTAGDSALAKNAQLLAGYLKTLTGNSLKITDKPTNKNAIILTASLANDNPEAYCLTVTSEDIHIDGASAAGNFYGINTLRKSIVEAGDQNVVFPAAVIDDKPRFGYRGAHFDVVRHYFPIDSVKKFVDIIALHNINRLHWHISDDQGWRIEIKSRPELAERGSVRKGTAIGTDLNSCDSIHHGGYYTQDQVRDLIKYAADRHITVIPEIDLPGHMLGALTAYPELGCTGGPYELWTRWGVSPEVLCAGNDSVYALIEDVLTEVAELFPSEYVHIGGDECPKVRWKECEKCQAKIKALGLKDDENSTAEQKLQSHVMNFAADVLAKHGKKAIGWDEILEGGVEQSTTIMSWRGIKGAVKAARAGHDAIMTPTKYCYFDYIQAPEDVTDEQILTYHTFLPIDTVYSFEPLPAELTAEEAKHILGAQANLWTEYIPTFSYAMYKELPRLAAMCEVQWTAPEQKDFADFKRRLAQLVKQYDVEGYNYAKFVFAPDTIPTPKTDE